MFDSKMHPLIKPLFHHVARQLDALNMTANQITLFGFLIGMCVIPALAFHADTFALLAIVFNRMMDGLDGALARIQGVTNAGGYLDICLDFLFYSAVPFGFALASPEENALAATFLIFSFIGTGSSFLAFAVMAEKMNIKDRIYQHKSLYYMSGLTEGTETIVCFLLMVLFPQHFVLFACVFGTLCWFTTCTRIYCGYRAIQHTESSSSF